MAHTEFGDDSADLLAQVMEEYFDRLRRGEQPRLEEFVERYPEISHLLKTVIPGLQAAEPTADVSVDGKVSHERHKQIGDFRILRQIGRGGMGIVYEAEQISMNRRVALKVLPLAGLVDELKIRRFQNEVRAVAALNHPHIVPVYTVGEERGVHYYAMQLIRGRSLSDVIASLRRVRDGGEEFNGSSISQITSPGQVDDGANAEPTISNELRNADFGSEAVQEPATAAKVESSTIPHSSRREYFRSVATLGIQAASALQHAHDGGVIHRDIKPANLLLDSASKLYVTDFGLARIESDVGVTMTGDLIGTLRYMAPEQALAKRVVVDHRADIYSLATTLYELLTLRPAYLADDRQELLKQIAFQEPTPLRRIDRDIPTELETIIHKAMSKDMDLRYASAQELADDLRSHLENRPIRAKPPTTSEIIGKWTRRNPALMWATVVTLALVTMTLVATTFLIRNERDIARTAESNAKQVAEARRQELYAASISLAYQAWSDGDLQLAQTLLALQRPDPRLPNQSDLRGFEWRYLWQLCQDESRLTLPTFTGNDVDLFRSHLMSFSADGSKLAISEGTTVKVWDFARPRELPTENLHTHRITAVVFSPTDRDLLAIGDIDGQIKLWNIATNAAQTIVAGTSSADSPGPSSSAAAVASLAFSPEGDKIVSAMDDGQIIKWDVETRTQDWSTLGHWDTIGVSGKKKPAPALCVAYSPDRTLVASGGGDTNVRLWNAETGEQVGKTLEDHTAFVRTLEFSPDGPLLATGGFDGRLFLWDVTVRGAGNPRSLVGHRNVVRSVAFSPDGKTLVSGGGDTTIRCWSTVTGTQIRILRGHLGSIHSLAYSPDGQSLASASDKTAKLWPAPSLSDQDVFEHSGWVWAVALSPDGKTLFTSDHHALAIKLWDVPSRGFLQELRVHSVVDSLTISPNGQFLSSQDRGQAVVRLWDLAKHEEVDVYQGTPLSFSADSRFIRVLSAGRIKYWDIRSGREFELFRGDSRSILCAAFSPNDDLLAAQYEDGRVRVWDTHDWKEIASFEKNAGGLIFSSDGHLIAASGEGCISLFDIAKQEIRELPTLRGIMAFAPDSKTLAVVDWDSTIELWNVASGQVALRLRQQGPVVDVAFSNDGTLMVTCGADGTARLWPAASLTVADALLRTGAKDGGR